MSRSAGGISAASSTTDEFAGRVALLYLHTASYRAHLGGSHDHQRTAAHRQRRYLAARVDALRAREKAATRELDAIAAQRRRMPMVEMPDYTLDGAEGPVRLADIFGGG